MTEQYGIGPLEFSWTLICRLVELEQQRDELLAACEAALNVIDFVWRHVGAERECETVMPQLKSAIEKARGDA